MQKRLFQALGNDKAFLIIKIMIDNVACDHKPKHLNQNLFLKFSNGMRFNAYVYLWFFLEMVYFETQYS